MCGLSVIKYYIQITVAANTFLAKRREFSGSAAYIYPQDSSQKQTKVYKGEGGVSA